MHCINYRIGILFRQNLAKKSYEMRYFFIDDEANLFYISSLARLQKLIRLSSDFKEVKTKLLQMGEKSFSLNKYTPSGPRNYQSQAILPFSNRTCIDIKEKESKQQKGYQMFGLIDDDTPLLYEEILRLTGRKKVEIVKRTSVIQEQKNKQQQRTADFFAKFLQNQQKFKMSNISQENKELQFQGDMQSHEAEGRWVEMLTSEGITYTGFFKGGKKHGTGLLVSDTLAFFECEFYEDELVGI